VPAAAADPASAAGPPPPGALTDADILNFALNLEYLEAQFYAFAATATYLAGQSADRNRHAGRGDRRRAGEPSPIPWSRNMPGRSRLTSASTSPSSAQALGSAAVAQPALDIGSVTRQAPSPPRPARPADRRRAGVRSYANDENFLLGAFIFEDVGVTAYKGASPLITNKTFLEAAAGILAAEAYHAGLIRTVLYGKGIQTPALRTATTEQISDARDSLDNPSDVDQGVRQRGERPTSCRPTPTASPSAARRAMCSTSST
jgi:hypothetical protein